jgi:hypothetical protein
MDLKPGINITVVTGIDSVKERIHVHDAVIYDIKGPTITISQTDPPLLRSLVGKEIDITYLVTEKDDRVRYGFPAEMKEFIDDYPYNPTHKVEAIVVVKKGQADSYNLRMFYRVEPTSRSGLAIAIEGKPINALDVSVGGARLSYSEDSLQLHSSPRTTILIDSTAYPVEVKVLRTWEREIEGLGRKLRFAAIQFLNMNVDLEDALSRKIREIEMENLRKINSSSNARAM